MNFCKFVSFFIWSVARYGSNDASIFFCLDMNLRPSQILVAQKSLKDESIALSYIIGNNEVHLGNGLNSLLPTCCCHNAFCYKITFTRIFFIFLGICYWNELGILFLTASSSNPSAKDWTLPLASQWQLYHNWPVKVANMRLYSKRILWRVCPMNIWVSQLSFILPKCIT